MCKYCSKDSCSELGFSSERSERINTQGNGPPEIGQKHASLDNNLTCGKLKSLKELLW